MSSSTTAATSPPSPATEGARGHSRASALRATAWLRVALIAGLAGAVTALVFDLLVAEDVIDRAIALEEGRPHTHALGVPAPFSRSGQKGGLVVGELMLGLGFGLVLAGALTYLTPLVAPARRLWLLVTGAVAWAVIVLPAVAYPALPPGVASGLGTGERQLLWLAAVAIGLASFAIAAIAWRRSRLLAAAVLVTATTLAAFLPDQRASATDGSLLFEFRAAATVSQVLFWATLAAAGHWLLGRRAGEAAAPRGARAS